MTHPITPPTELVQQWFKQAHESADPDLTFISTAAAQWGADQELEACCEWIPKKTPWDADQLRTARRPKSLTLGERIEAELAANTELSPELRAILIEAKSVVGEVVK